MPTTEPITDDALLALKIALDHNMFAQTNVDPQTVARLLARLEGAEKSRDDWHDAAEHWKAERKLREEAFAVDGQTEDLLRAVNEWRQARRAFLDLPANDPGARAALDRLANAEDALMKGAQA